jgi:hypothetical protein
VHLVEPSFDRRFRGWEVDSISLEFHPLSSYTLISIHFKHLMINIRHVSNLRCSDVSSSSCTKFVLYRSSLSCPIRLVSSLTQAYENEYRTIHLLLLLPDRKIEQPKLYFLRATMPNVVEFKACMVYLVIFLLRFVRLQTGKTKNWCQRNVLSCFF